MPRQIFFIQGGGAGAHDQWDNRLVDSLKRELGDGYEVRYPRMPNEADPRYAAWKSALLKEIDALADGAVLVGHSVGATILIHTLAEARPNVRAAALVLIAPPFIGDGGWPGEDMTPRADFQLPAGMPVFLYHGSDDDTVPSAHMRLYAEALADAVVRDLPHRDHQLNDDLSEVARDIRALG